MDKVSFDLDGTLYDNKLMPVFLFLCHALKNHGTKIYILTGHNFDSEADDREKLRKLGYPEFDGFFGRPPEYQDKNGSVFKRMVIAREGIDIHFDDCDYDNQESIALIGDLLGTKVVKV